jgi:hypothetical protein
VTEGFDGIQTNDELGIQNRSPGRSNYQVEKVANQTEHNLDLTIKNYFPDFIPEEYTYKGHGKAIEDEEIQGEIDCLNPGSTNLTMR